MKKILITFICFLTIVASAKAQEDIFKIIANETCECVTKRNIDTSKRKEIELALGLCMLESIQSHDVDIEVSDGEAMRKFGEKVGLQMALICPLLFSSFIEEGEKEEVEILELYGKIKSIETDEFLFVILKEESGKEHKLLWFRYFPGSDEFKNDPRKLVGKNVAIIYENVECYFPKRKAYYDSKEIRELKLNN